jgi:hypothetical protein
MIPEVRLQEWLHDSKWSTDEGGFHGMEVSDTDVSARHLLAMVLQIGVVDLAESIHYLPLQPLSNTHAILCYLVRRQYYELFPPPDFLARRVFTQARTLLTPDPAQRFLNRLLGRSAIGRFRVMHESTPTEWFGVCRSRGDLRGLDFYRLWPEGIAPPPIDETTGSAEPKGDAPVNSASGAA